MDREKARKAAEVMLAYADGKKIEQLWGEQWVINKEPKFDWGYSDYRIKSEPKYHPFKDAEECWQEMQKHQPFGWLKSNTTENFWALHSVYDADDEDFWDCFFKGNTFADGTPFGIKEEE